MTEPATEAPAARPRQRKGRKLLAVLKKSGGPLARYSRFVGLMQILLPSLAAVLLALVVAWPKLMQDDDRFRLGFAKLSPKEVETLSMVNAHYYGVDQANRPFAVSADLAVQQPNAPDLIDLKAPKADLTSSSGANIFVDADTGLYHQAAKMLDLVGNVSLFHDAGYELHTNSATIDLARNAAKGTEPVTGQGPQGRTIDAEGFEIRERGQEVVFTGKAKLVMGGVGAQTKKARTGGARR